MSFSLKTLKLFQQAGVTGETLYELLASIQEDFSDRATRVTGRVSRRRRKSLIGYSPIKWEKRRQSVFERDKFTCQYCGEPDLDFPTVDHVMPLSRGGSNDTSNLVTACEACNGDKADMTLEEWGRAKRTARPIPERKPYTLKDLRRPTKLSKSRSSDRAIVEEAQKALQSILH